MNEFLPQLANSFHNPVLGGIHTLESPSDSVETGREHVEETTSVNHQCFIGLHLYNITMQYHIANESMQIISSYQIVLLLLYNYVILNDILKLKK